VTRLLAAALLVIATAHDAVAQQETPAPPRTFEVAPRAYMQVDWRGYPDWDVTPGSGRLNLGTFDIRRARVGIDGRFRQVTFELTVDPEDDDGVLVKDAYAQLRVSRAIRIRAGQFKLPGGREYQTSARNIDFMERAALAGSVTPGRDIGAMLTGEIGPRFDYQAGLFAGDGNGRGERARMTGAARAAWELTNDLQIAGTMSEGRTAAADADPANGLDGRSASGYRFFERVYVQGRRSRRGVDAAWSPGRWRVAAEAIRATEARDGQGLDFEDLPGIVTTGWSASVLRQFGRRQGAARSRIREWDLALRYDTLSFDDEGPDTGRDSVRPRATDVRARAAQTWTIGASWNLSRWARILTNAAAERYSEPRSAPSAGKEGPYWTVGPRRQFQLP
jgi:phosphate-selective porin